MIERLHFVMEFSLEVWIHELRKQERKKYSPNSKELSGELLKVLYVMFSSMNKMVLQFEIYPRNVFLHYCSSLICVQLLHFARDCSMPSPAELQALVSDPH